MVVKLFSCSFFVEYELKYMLLHVLECDSISDIQVVMIDVGMEGASSYFLTWCKLIPMTGFSIWWMVKSEFFYDAIEIPQHADMPKGFYKLCHINNLFLIIS